MRYHAKVKTSIRIVARCTVAAGWLVAGRVPAQDIDPIGAKSGESRLAALDPKAAGLLKALHPPLETRIFATADRLVAGSTTLRLSLAEHRFRVFAGDELAIDCPASTGRTGCPTATGEFRIEAKAAQPKGLDYGHVLAADGTILIRGTCSRRDPLPAGAVFNPVIPKCAFKATAGGPTVLAGEATGASTTDGSVIIPDKVALLLFDKLEAGVKFIVE
jgi:hypothetical protein